MITKNNPTKVVMVQPIYGEIRYVEKIKITYEFVSEVRIKRRRSKPKRKKYWR